MSLLNWRRNLPRLFGLLTICSVWLHLPQVLSAHEEPSNGKHFLWRVDSPTTCVYLVGSIHVLRQDVYPLAPVIEQAFAASDVLVLEADPFAQPQGELQQTIMAYATYPEGQTLKSQLSEQDYFKVSSVLFEAGIPSGSVQQYQPWYVTSMVDQVLSSRLGLRPEYGIDFYFRSKAEQKEVKELESLETQLQLLSGFSDEEQVLMMLWAVEDLEHAAKEFDEFLQIWQRGDIQAMEEQLQKEFQEEPRFKPIWNVMVEKRNPAMADQIATFMRTNKRHFVIVGVAHLVGPQGLITLLRQRGCTIQQL